MHFDYTRPDGLWPQESVPGQADYQRFDVKQFKSLNGDDGGSWSPTTPIILGGGVLTLTSSGSQITGGVKTSLGGSIALGASDFPQLSPARTITRTLDITAWPGSTLLAAPISGVFIPNNSRPFPIPPRYLIHGGTSQLSSITMWYRLLSRAKNVPASSGSPLLTPNALLLSVNNIAQSVSFGAPNPQGPIQLYNEGSTGGFDHWTALRLVSVGQYVIAAQNAGTPPVWSYFRCTAVAGLGSTGASEPSWNTTIGSTTIDDPGANQVTWTCVGPYGAPYWPDAETAFAGGYPQPLTLAFDTTINQTLRNDTSDYTVNVANASVLAQYGAAVLFHSLQFTFTNVTSMTWE